MTLAMTRPWQHPKTGMFWLRRRVPKDLLPLIGKREEKLSLATKDAAEARRRFAKALADVEARWAALRSAPPEAAGTDEPRRTALSEREAHRRAEWMYTYWLDKYREDPSTQTFWPVDAYDRIWTSPPAHLPPPSSTDVTPLVPPFDVEAFHLKEWCFEQADLLLVAHDLLVDQDSRAKLARALSASVQRASVELARQARGDFQAADPVPVSLTRRGQHEVEAQVKLSLSFDALVRGWAAEKRPVERTLYEWTRVLGDLAAFLGHDDARRLTTADLLAWKAKLIELGRKPR